jgi:hypothetical protein
MNEAVPKLTEFWDKLMNEGVLMGNIKNGALQINVTVWWS